MYTVKNSIVIDQQKFPEHPFVIYNRKTGDFEDIAEDIEFIIFKMPKGETKC